MRAAISMRGSKPEWRARAPASPTALLAGAGHGGALGGRAGDSSGSAPPSDAWPCSVAWECAQSAVAEASEWWSMRGAAQCGSRAASRPSPLRSATGSGTCRVCSAWRGASSTALGTEPMQAEANAPADALASSKLISRPASRVGMRWRVGRGIGKQNPVCYIHGARSGAMPQMKGATTMAQDTPMAPTPMQIIPEPKKPGAQDRASAQPRLWGGTSSRFWAHGAQPEYRFKQA